MKLFTDFFLITGLVIIFIIIWFLYQSPKKDLSHKILILIFVLLFFSALEFYGYLHRIKSLFFIGYLVGDSYGFIGGPLLLIYVKSLYQENEGLLRKNIYHFIPLPIYAFIFSIPVLISLMIGKPLFSYLELLDDTNFPDLLIISQNIYIVFYISLSLSLLAKYQSTLKQNFSNLIDKDLAWVRQLLIGFVVVISIDLMTTTYELIFGEFDWQIGFITIFAMIVLVVYLAYYGITQSQILLPEFLLKEPVHHSHNTNTSVRHHLSNVKTEEINNLKTRLYEILEKEKPYLQDDLTLNGLAILLPTSDKKLSALLNHYLDITFYDLINNYRVEEVISKFNDRTYENYTLLAIAFECGFSSKSSFNRIFKKSKGMSPSAFKKSNS